MDSLELEEPCRTQINDFQAVARIEKAYAQIVDRIRERKAMQVQQQADEEKRKKDGESNILKHKPEVLLHGLIDERFFFQTRFMKLVSRCKKKRLVPGGGLGGCAKGQS